MKPRVLAVFALAAGLLLSLALAVLAQRVELEDANEALSDAASVGPALSLTALRNPTSSDFVPEIASTPAFTTYLLAVFRGHPYSSTIPTLISPASGSNLDTLIPLFIWDSGNDPNATALYLDVWRDAQLTDRVASLRSSDRTQGTHQWRIDLNLDPATTYYWRVHLICGNARELYSEVWSFTTGSGGTILPGPDLLSPENGSTRHGVIYGHPSGFICGAGATLQWLPVSGAVEYQVHACDERYTRVVTDVEASLHWQLLNDCIWSCEWWVQARNDYAWGTESAHWQFTIEYR